MKRYNLLLLLLLLPCLAFGQEVLQSFNTAIDSSYWAYENSPNSTKNFTNLFLDNNIVKVGSGSMKVDWAIQAVENYGGYSNIMHGAPGTEVFDFSPYTHMKVWYYNASPQTLTGTTEFRILFKDMSDVPVADRTMANIGRAEFWYSQFLILDAQPGWNELVLPLKDVGQHSNQGVWLPGWAGATNGNHLLDLDAIKAWKFEWSINNSVYDPANPQNSGTSAGTIYFDNLALYGHAFPVINYFDTTASVNASYAGTGTSSISVTDNTQEFFETASAQFDWKVDADQSWGGFTSLTYGDNASFLPDMRGHTHLSLRYNNFLASSRPGNVVFRIQLHEYSEGDNSEEVWVYQENTILDGPSGWNKLMIPLDDRGANVQPNEQGFSNPGWGPTLGNSKLDLDKVKKYEIIFSAAQQGTVSTGGILFDNLELYGKRQTDFDPPAQVQGVSAVPDATGNFNLVIWQDVPGEVEEKYTVYASRNPITDVTALGVDVLAEGIAENTQTFVHYLFSPLENKPVTYYYAVRATDKVGNIGPVGVSKAVTGTAKGVATISLNPPAKFAADGDLGEWQHIKPFVLNKSNTQVALAHVGLGAFDNDDDMNATIYMAVDNTYFYFAADVIDDVFSYDPGGNWYEDDAIELFLGFYEGRPGPQHAGMQRGEQPDYSLHFRANVMVNGFNGDKVIYTPDSTDYFFEGLGASDYIVECRIKLTDIAFGADKLFVPVNGMQIPIDIQMHDSDHTNVRDGMLVLSTKNDNDSWQSPRNWAYAWIGNQEFPTSVADKGTDGVPLSYSLSQNYPNPFNPTTKISYAIRKPGLVRIELYNTLGQKVRTLVDEAKPAGAYTLEVQANTLPSGVYFYRINAGDFKQTRKMLLMK